MKILPGNLYAGYRSIVLVVAVTGDLTVYYVIKSSPDKLALMMESTSVSHFLGWTTAHYVRRIDP